MVLIQSYFIFVRLFVCEPGQGDIQAEQSEWRGCIVNRRREVLGASRAGSPRGIASLFGLPLRVLVCMGAGFCLQQRGPLLQAVSPDILLLRVCARYRLAPERATLPP